MNSLYDNNGLPLLSFLIRKSPDQSLLTTPRSNIAVCRVLHRLLMPRHPPYALNNLTFR